MFINGNIKTQGNKLSIYHKFQSELKTEAYMYVTCKNIFLDPTKVHSQKIHDSVEDKFQILMQYSLYSDLRKCLFEKVTNSDRTFCELDDKRKCSAFQ